MLIRRMNKMPIFECAKCGDVFEGDGLHVIVHEKSIGRVCPACITNAKRITIVLERPAPGKPYAIAYNDVELPNEDSDASDIL